MPETRRGWLVGMGAIGAVFVLRPLTEAQVRTREPQPLPSPNAPNPAYPPGFNGPEQTPDKKDEPDPLKQQSIKADVEKLYQMVEELKKDVEKSDARVALSVGVVKRAGEIEKLAKKIKNEAKG